MTDKEFVAIVISIFPTLDASSVSVLLLPMMVFVAIVTDFFSVRFFFFAGRIFCAVPVSHGLSQIRDSN